MIHSLKKFTVGAQDGSGLLQGKCLLASAAKYCHNQMDGKVELISLDSMLEATQAELVARGSKGLDSVQSFES